MRLLTLACLLLAGAAASPLVSTAANSGMAPTVVMPGHVKWVPQPGGYSMATLYGDPSKSGYYVIRLNLPANWKFPAHYHPGRENVTVISGTLYAAMGTKWDSKKLMAFPAGSFISIPPRAPHYATVKTPTVIEISGTEPNKDVMLPQGRM